MIACEIIYAPLFYPTVFTYLPIVRADKGAVGLNSLLNCR